MPERRESASRRVCQSAKISGVGREGVVVRAVAAAVAAARKWRAVRREAGVAGEGRVRVEKAAGVCVGREVKLVGARRKVRSFCGTVGCSGAGVMVGAGSAMMAGPGGL